MSATEHAWFAGLTCDHLYADCPNRTRAEVTLRRCGEWDMHGVGIDPDGSDVCGMCVHRYRRDMPSIDHPDRHQRPHSPPGYADTGTGLPTSQRGAQRHGGDEA